MRGKIRFYVLICLLLICLLLIFTGTFAVAEEMTPTVQKSSFLQETLVTVAREETAARSENQITRAEIKKVRAQALAAKAAVAKQVKEIKTKIANREVFLEKLAGEQRELEKKSHQALYELNELAGVVRTSARDLASLLESSPVSGDKPGRVQPVHAILSKNAYPGMQEIKVIADLYLDEIVKGGEVRRSQNSFIGLDGHLVRGEIIRLGALSTIYQSDADKSCGYAVYGSENDALLAVSQAGWRVSKSLKKFIAGESNAVYLDFSGGDAVRRLALTPSSWERLRSGGILIWPILLVGLVALLLSLERFLFLSRVKSNTDRVMGKIVKLVEAGDFGQSLELVKNRKGPVFRVLAAGLAARKATRDVLESVLEEAILKELPRLEKFLPTLQVLAAIAPLLGLLGTVTGMINTFQVITVYGAGDPRMMSGGISEALVTTKLGLTVAIPIILLHTWFARRVDVIIGDMEEKSVSLSIALQDSESGSR
ncbi:MAG: MotA [Deltaproteobacteria bacterium]|nr:MAG: MotA [Deltaproteobacteria bacterium]